jgi:hypothetical protein
VAVPGKNLKLKLTPQQIAEIKNQLGLDLSELHLEVEELKVLKVRDAVASAADIGDRVSN